MWKLITDCVVTVILFYRNDYYVIKRLFITIEAVPNKQRLCARRYTYVYIYDSKLSTQRLVNVRPGSFPRTRNILILLYSLNLYPANLLASLLYGNTTFYI